MSLNQLSKLLPLPTENLQQVLDYAASLPKEEIATNFQNLLGTSSSTTEFTSAFISQLYPEQAISDKASCVKTHRKKSKKVLAHTTPVQREVPDTSASGTPNQKKHEDYIVTSKKPNKEPPLSTSSITQPKSQPCAPPSAAGPLISDFGPNLTKKKPTASLSKANPKNSSKFANKTKITIAGGKALHGESTILSELDAAIRCLEISTNSKLESQDPAKRACNCIGTRHPILTAAPNCLSCGKVICVMEGIGPCTFCGTHLLSSTEMKSMISHLREERGREKMLIGNISQKRAQVASTPKSFSAPREESLDFPDGMSRAKIDAQTHRDKLLNFQAQNASRTTVRDEVAEFTTEGNEVRRDMQWATPFDRAQALKKQQKLLREMEWQERPEYERRGIVVSLDVVKGKVIKRIQKVERKREDDAANEDLGKLEDVGSTEENEGEISHGRTLQAFSKNPLLGDLIRPVWTAGVDSKLCRDVGDNERESSYKVNSWRRVQDSQEDNEEIILDGGITRR